MEHLAELFPEYSAGALWATLESNDYDVAATAEELCQLESEFAAQWEPPTAPQPDRRSAQVRLQVDAEHCQQTGRASAMV